MDATEPKTKPERKERKPKEDEKPIEELFDLSKPIPKVDKMCADAHASLRTTFILTGITGRKTQQVGP